MRDSSKQVTESIDIDYEFNLDYADNICYVPEKRLAYVGCQHTHELLMFSLQTRRRNGTLHFVDEPQRQDLRARWVIDPYGKYLVLFPSRAQRGSFGISHMIDGSECLDRSIIGNEVLHLQAHQAVSVWCFAFDSQSQLHLLHTEIDAPAVTNDEDGKEDGDGASQSEQQRQDDGDGAMRDCNVYWSVLRRQGDTWRLVRRHCLGDRDNRCYHWMQVDDVGNMIVLELQQRHVLVIDGASGRVVRRYSHGRLLFHRMALDSHANFLVVADRVFLTERSGKAVRQFGTRSTFCGRGGCGIAVDPLSGDLLICDYFNNILRVVPRFTRPAGMTRM
jgi:hypothetical protein